MKTCRSIRGNAVLAAAFTALLLLTPPVVGQGKGKPPNSQQLEQAQRKILEAQRKQLQAQSKQVQAQAQAQSNAMLVEVSNVLRATKLTLQTADADYQGHRVKAIGAIGAAENQLRGALSSQKIKLPPSPPAPARKALKGGLFEPQVISNLQLAQSIQLLSQSRVMLASAAHDYNGKRVRAMSDIGTAITELQAGLATVPADVFQNQSYALIRMSWHILQNTQTTLRQADHDYGGHRVKAVRAIEAAQTQLRRAMGKRPLGFGADGSAGEPQGLSDLQLAQAIPVLRMTVNIMQYAGHNFDGHKARAVRDTQAAINQLERALAYEQKRQAVAQ